jgi:PAS domain S-box-containing protein
MNLMTILAIIIFSNAVTICAALLVFRRWWQKPNHDTSQSEAKAELSQREIIDKQVEAHLLEIEYRYRMLFEANADAVFWVSLDGIILNANQRVAEIFGYSLDELIGMHTKHLIAADEFPQSLNIAHTLFVEKKPIIYERWHVRKNSERLLAEINLAVVCNPDGEPLYMQSILRDITERKKAEQQSLALALEIERVQLLTNFIQDMSHEFRTPLAVIQSSLHIIQKTDNPEKRQEKAVNVNQQVMRIVELVDRLVLMTQLDSGVHFMTQRTNINSLIQQTTDAMEKPFAEKNLVLQLELDSTLPQIDIDAVRVVEALSQLLENAIYYTPPAGNIRIQTGYTAASLTVTIADTGVGITREALPRIFERFYRSDEAHSTSGFGLGLPIAQKIIESHGGHIEVQSEVGSGSHFTIYLPINR